MGFKSFKQYYASEAARGGKDQVPTVTGVRRSVVARPPEGREVFELDRVSGLRWIWCDTCFEHFDPL